MARLNVRRPRNQKDGIQTSRPNGVGTDCCSDIRLLGYAPVPAHKILLLAATHFQLLFRCQYSLRAVVGDPF